MPAERPAPWRSGTRAGWLRIEAVTHFLSAANLSTSTQSTTWGWNVQLAGEHVLPDGWQQSNPGEPGGAGATACPQDTALGSSPWCQRWWCDMRVSVLLLPRCTPRGGFGSPAAFLPIYLLQLLDQQAGGEPSMKAVSVAIDEALSMMLLAIEH
ncbi:unnamed protein product [Caretta caretta]